jgi:hypothetical protein
VVHRCCRHHRFLRSGGEASCYDTASEIVANARTYPLPRTKSVMATIGLPGRLALRFVRFKDRSRPEAVMCVFEKLPLSTRQCGAWPSGGPVS